MCVNEQGRAEEHAQYTYTYTTTFTDCQGHCSGKGTCSLLLAFGGACVHYVLFESMYIRIGEKEEGFFLALRALLAQ